MRILVVMALGACVPADVPMRAVAPSDAARTAPAPRLAEVPQFRLDAGVRPEEAVEGLAERAAALEARAAVLSAPVLTEAER